jgi:hypothetical protein
MPRYITVYILNISSNIYIYTYVYVSLSSSMVHGSMMFHDSEVMGGYGYVGEYNVERLWSGHPGTQSSGPRVIADNGDADYVSLKNL